MINSNIKMIPVQSSNVKSVGYDEDNGNVHIEFASGERYAYMGVPKKVYEDLLIAKSIGAYINRHLKKSYEAIPQKS